MWNGIVMIDDTVVHMLMYDAFTLSPMVMEGENHTEMKGKSYWTDQFSTSMIMGGGLPIYNSSRNMCISNQISRLIG